MAEVSKVFHHVFFVETDVGRPINPIAIRPELFSTKATWEDTSRGMSIDVEKIDGDLKKDPPLKIGFTTKSGEHFTLRFLTKELYDEKVKKHVAGSPSFRDDKQLQEYYLKTNFQQYF